METELRVKPWPYDTAPVSHTPDRVLKAASLMLITNMSYVRERELRKNLRREL